MAKSKTLASFHKLHDPVVVAHDKIVAGLAAFRKAEGDEGWETDQEFLKRAKVANQDAGKVREQFAPYQTVARVPGGKDKVYWFATQTAKLLAEGTDDKVLLAAAKKADADALKA